MQYVTITWITQTNPFPRPYVSFSFHGYLNFKKRQGTDKEFAMNQAKNLH